MQSHQLIHTKWLHARHQAVRKVAPCTRPCSGCWWSSHCCPSKRWRRTTWKDEKVCDPVCRAGLWNLRWGSCVFLNTTWNLHVHLSVVDEVLQRVSARVEILELGVVGDGADRGVKGSDHPADVDRLDVGEVWENSSSWSTGSLWKYCRERMID